MHCQICLCPLPHHAVNCPVFTGEPQLGSLSDQQAHYAIDKALSQGQEQLLKSGMMAAGRHDPAAIELRIEYLEKELALLRARIAKLEREQ
jgi:hypothetical protein